MTKDKLIEQGEQQVLYEEMDWEPMKDEEIAFEVSIQLKHCVLNNQQCSQNLQYEYILVFRPLLFKNIFDHSNHISSNVKYSCFI